MLRRKRAEQFLAMACKDYKALQGMTDGAVFSVEVFGFHAQQTVEKCLKAWLEALNIDAPMTHNLIVLLATLEEQCVNVEQLWELVHLNSFAVQFRYEQYDESLEDVDRTAIIHVLGDLLEQVSTLLKTGL